MIQIGISCYYHDSSVCLIKDGKVILAVEEERFSGIKHDSSFPDNSIKWIMKESGIEFEEPSATLTEIPSAFRDFLK